jgi:hypothetical protein
MSWPKFATGAHEQEGGRRIDHARLRTVKGKLRTRLCQSVLKSALHEVLDRACAFAAFHCRSGHFPAHSQRLDCMDIQSIYKNPSHLSRISKQSWRIFVVMDIITVVQKVCPLNTEVTASGALSSEAKSWTMHLL